MIVLVLTVAWLVVCLRQQQWLAVVIGAVTIMAIYNLLAMWAYDRRHVRQSLAKIAHLVMMDERERVLSALHEYERAAITNRGGSFTPSLSLNRALANRGTGE